MDITIEQILGLLDKVPEERVREIKEKLDTLPDQKIWLPNSGGQKAVVASEADEIFCGSRPGCGKTSLLIGLAITEHQDSIIFRREFPQIRGLESEATKILKGRNGYNAADHVWRVPGTDRILEFGSVQHEWNVEKYQGRAHDFKGFDEITSFTRSQYRFLTLWLRPLRNPSQRCRIICAGNPPTLTNPEGYWVFDHWSAWLDKEALDPAAPGELRWPVPSGGSDDKDIFFRSKQEAMQHLEHMPDAPRDHLGKVIPPRSRTFIPMRLEDTPDLYRAGYQSVLAYAPRELKDLAAGNFEKEVPDDPRQVIPTAWILAAQERWRAAKGKPQTGVPMTAIGVDVAMGGPDSTTLAPRYDAFFAELIVTPGKDTPMGSDVVALLVKHRRDGAAIIIDAGGGYASASVQVLKDNQVRPDPILYNGSNAATRRSQDRVYQFYNKRAQAYWGLREALDPEQQHGSPVCLPDDRKLLEELAAPRFEVATHGIKIEPKDDIKKRLGRSPDRADAVVMCWEEGQKALKRGLIGPNARPVEETRQAFAKVRPGPLTRKNRYGDQGKNDDSGTPPWRR